MKSISLKSEILIMVLVMPVTFFITSGVVSDNKDLNLNYFLVCAFSVTLGILFGAAFSKYFLFKISKMKHFAAFAFFISFVTGILLSFMIVTFVKPAMSMLGSTEFLIGFFISAWSLSLSSRTDRDGKHHNKD